MFIAEGLELIGFFFLITAPFFCFYSLHQALKKKRKTAECDRVLQESDAIVQRAKAVSRESDEILRQLSHDTHDPQP